VTPTVEAMFHAAEARGHALLGDARTFATVAQTENLTAAAERLHLVQSTVTAQVQALEKELDLRLFDRLPRGVVLTGAGREVLAQAEAVLEAESTTFPIPPDRRAWLDEHGIFHLENKEA